MLIPVRCWTCGKVIADLHQEYLRRVEKYKVGKDSKGDTIINLKNVVKTPEGRAMDELGITSICCRRMVLSHKEIIG